MKGQSSQSQNETVRVTASKGFLAIVKVHCRAVYCIHEVSMNNTVSIPYGSELYEQIIFDEKYTFLFYLCEKCIF